jgi:integrase
MGTFTARGVETETKLGYHADPGCEGLYLQVCQGKNDITRSWLFRYTSPTTGKRREMGLGPLCKQSLAGARKRAREAWQRVLDGQDPIEEARKQAIANQLEQSKAITFDKAAALCIAAKKHEWRNAKHVSQWTNTLAEYASPVIGKIPVQQVDTGLVLRILQPIWTTKTETATRVRQRIESVIDFCKARGQFAGDNPARLDGHLSELLPKASKIQRVQHHSALPFEQIHPFITKLREKGGTAMLALEFLILTAARTGEVIGARWDEVDLQNRVWSIPAERMKAGKQHRVPLNARAVEILNTLHATATNSYIFPGWKTDADMGLSNGAVLALMKGMDDYKQHTPHGFRSTFRDWCAERTNYPNEVIEMALAHTIENRVEAAYRRGDLFEKRARLMADWAKYIETPVRPARVHDLKEQTA